MIPSASGWNYYFSAIEERVDDNQGNYFVVGTLCISLEFCPI